MGEDKVSLEDNYDSAYLSADLLCRECGYVMVKDLYRDQNENYRISKAEVYCAVLGCSRNGIRYKLPILHLELVDTVWDATKTVDPLNRNIGRRIIL